MAVGKQHSNRLIWILRFAGTLLFLGLILRAVDLPVLVDRVREITWPGYILLFLAFLFVQCLTAVRWKILLGLVDIQEPLPGLLTAVLYGQTINKILPSSIGGDSARAAYLVRKHPWKKTLSVSATLLDRVLSFLVLLFFALLSLPFFDGFDVQQKILLEALLLLILLGVVLFYLGTLDNLIHKLMDISLLPQGLRAFLTRLGGAFMTYRNRPRGMAGVLLLSFFRQAVMITNIYFTFRLVGASVPLLDLLIVVPLVTFLVILPISIGGIGIREAGLMGLLQLEGEVVLSFTLIRYSFLLLVPVLLLGDSLLGPLVSRFSQEQQSSEDSHE